MAEKAEEKKIDEALELLNELARDKKDELQDRITHKYQNLKSVLGGIAQNLQHEAQEGYVEGREEVRELASKIDSSLHKNPWPYLGGTALGFLLLGLFLGRSKR